MPFPALTIAGASSFASSAISIYNFQKQFRSTNQLKQLKIIVEKRAENKESFKSYSTKDDEKLLEIADYAGCLVGQLRSKLVGRFILALALIIGSTFAASEVIDWTQPTTTQKILTLIPIILTQIIGVLMTTKHLFLDKTEGTFLENLQILHEWFYRRYVYEAINNLNLELPKLQSFRDAKGLVEKAKGEFLAQLHQSKLINKTNNDLTPPPANFRG